jgi:hypothetical protein
MTLGGKMTADVLVGSIEYGNVLDVKYGNVLILIWLNDDSRRPVSRVLVLIWLNDDLRRPIRSPALVSH